VICHRVKSSVARSFVQNVLPITIVGSLLIAPPGAFGQHLAGGRSGGFSGVHVGGFSGGGFQRNFSAPRSFGGFSGPAPRAFSFAPRMNWTAPRYGFAPQRQAFAGYRPTYGTENRGADHRVRYRRPYPGYVYGGYPYVYANSWELLPWDIGYPDFTGYEDDNEPPEQNNSAQPSGEDGQQPPQEDEGYRSEYVSVPYQSPANHAATSAPASVEPQLTLIFKDGHTQEIRNYVVTPQEVIIMDDAASGRIPRISLSDLNLPATEQAAQGVGLDFSPPST
jgi:hypothetical protein